MDRYMADFFVSYTSADKAWAEWISYVLEEEGFTVVIQAWDFRPGSNFVVEMQRAATEADRTIMVLSPDYLKSQFASSEWAAAFAGDPEGLKRKLVPVMVKDCQPSGLLSSVVHVSLVGEDDNTARKLVLDGVNSKRAKPTQMPSFPGSATARTPKSFPGQAGLGGATLYVPNLKRSPTDADRRRFSRQAFDLIKAHFRQRLTTWLKKATRSNGTFNRIPRQSLRLRCSYMGRVSVAVAFGSEAYIPATVFLMLREVGITEATPAMRYCQSRTMRANCI
jgi:hypothetical protein